MFKGKNYSMECFKIIIGKKKLRKFSTLFNLDKKEMEIDICKRRFAAAAVRPDL